MPLLEERYPAGSMFSATSLERYADCPFRHFGEKTLGLEELERDESFMHWGLFVHDVLQRFHEARGPVPFDADTARPLLQRIFAEQWEAQGAKLEVSSRHTFEKALLDVCIGVSSFLAEHGFQQIEAEMKFEVTITGEDGSAFPIRGYIDRVDRRADGSELIADYKTGKMETGAKLLRRVETGRKLQLPLYGLARQLVAGKPVIHGVYVILNRGIEAEPTETPKFLINLGSLFAGERTRVVIPFDPEQAGKLATGFVARIREGMIPLTRFDVDDADPACVKYCSIRHVCRQPKGYLT
jgi:RecB family exonuclease